MTNTTFRLSQQTCSSCFVWLHVNLSAINKCFLTAKHHSYGQILLHLEANKTQTPRTQSTKSSQCHPYLKATRCPRYNGSDAQRYDKVNCESCNPKLWSGAWTAPPYTPCWGQRSHNAKLGPPQRPDIDPVLPTPGAMKSRCLLKKAFNEFSYTTKKTNPRFRSRAGFEPDPLRHVKGSALRDPFVSGSGKLLVLKCCEGTTNLHRKSREAGWDAGGTRCSLAGVSRHLRKVFHFKFTHVISAHLCESFLTPGWGL